MRGRSAVALRERGIVGQDELAFREGFDGRAGFAPGAPSGRAEVAVRSAPRGAAEMALRDPAGRSLARQPARVVPARAPAKQRSRGRSLVRLLLWAGTAVLAIAACVLGVLAFQARGSGPAHIVTTPSTLGSFVRRPQLEQQMHAGQLQQEVIYKSAGQVSHVVSAVYENGAGIAGTAAPKIILFLGGNLSQVTPSGFMASFTNQFGHARGVSAGPMGGLASCVDYGSTAVGGNVALCAWADNDTFGVVASPSMNVQELSAQLRLVRPSVEHLAK